MGERTYQQVLVNLQITIIVGEICRPVERCEALLVALIDLRPIVEKVVNLHSTGDEASFGTGKRQIVLSLPLLTMSSCLYVVAKCNGAPAPLSWVMK